MKPTQCEQCFDWIRPPHDKCYDQCDGRVDDKNTELVGLLFRLGCKFPNSRTVEEIAEEAVLTLFPDAELWGDSDDYMIYSCPDLQKMADGDVYLMVHLFGDVYVWLDEVVRRNCEVDGVDYLDVDLSRPLESHRVGGREISRKHLKLVR